MTKTIGNIELNYQGEQVWREFKGHLEWADNFSLLIVFTDSIAISELFYQRSKTLYSGELAKTQRCRPSNSELEAGALNSHIFSFLEQLPKEPCPVWLELSHLTQFSDDVSNLLQRLNERREKLRQQISSAFVITLPLVLADKLNIITPDLWSIRTASYRISIAEHSLMDTSSLANNGVEGKSTKSHSAANASVTEAPLYKEWQRLLKKGDKLKIDPAVIVLVYKLSRLLLADNNSDRKNKLVNWLTDTVLLADLKDRDKSIVNDIIGDMYAHLGELELALSRYQESLRLTKQIQQQQEDIPEVLRDISVYLDKVADIAMAKGDIEVASGYYQESLSLTKQIQRQLGDTPEVLRDTSVSLEKLANIAIAKSEIDRASSYYQESLSLTKQIQQQLGDTPQVLRDISVSLDKVANIAVIKGEIEAANSYYQESLSLRKQIQQQQGNTSEVLRDISISLNKLASIAEVKGNIEAASSYYQESLSLTKQIQQQLGDTPEVLRNIIVPLFNLVSIYKQENKIELAIDTAKQSLAIAQLRKERLGELPQVVEDLATITNELKVLETGNK